MTYKTIQIDEMRVRINSDVEYRLNKMPKDHQVEVKRIVGGYLRTSSRLRVPIDGLDRCWVEAMEQVKLDGVVGDVPLEEYVAFQRYHQYAAPRDLQS